MKIVKMDTNSFWKGEAGVVGLVEDQAHTFKTKLYLKNGQVKDYSCTCEKGNSYRGICAHGEALFAYYKEYQAEMSKPLVHSSSQVHTHLRGRRGKPGKTGACCDLKRKGCPAGI